MFYVKYILCVLSFLAKVGAQLGNDFNYQRIISMANIYFLDPFSNNQQGEIPILKLNNSYLLKNQNIKIIIHGWRANRNHVSITPLKYAYLAKGNDTVFMADWSRVGQIRYFEVKYVIKPLVTKLAKLLENFIKQNDIDLKRLHILGHSLGAHIAGYIGEYFNGNIDRITGLDPGIFFKKFFGNGLQSKHAKFVDVVHTGSPYLGQLEKCGHIDFYPNYGKVPQPGCERFGLAFAKLCSHSRAPLYFAESIQLPNNFPSILCPSHNIMTESCTKTNDTKIIYMGENLLNSTRESYFLRTNDASPFGRRIVS